MKKIATSNVIDGVSCLFFSLLLSTDSMKLYMHLYVFRSVVVFISLSLKFMFFSKLNIFHVINYEFENLFTFSLCSLFFLLLALFLFPLCIYYLDKYEMKRNSYARTIRVNQLFNFAHNISKTTHSCRVNSVWTYL